LLPAGAGVRYLLRQNRRLTACANSINVASRPGRDEGAITWPCASKGGRPPFPYRPVADLGRQQNRTLGKSDRCEPAHRRYRNYRGRCRLAPGANSGRSSASEVNDVHCPGRPDKRAHADAPRLLLRQTAPRRACFGVALWTPPHTIQRVLEGID